MGPPAQRGRGSKGVAIVLSPAGVAAWTAGGSHLIDDLGPRVIKVTLSMKDPLSHKRLDVLLVSAYAPVSTASDEDWEEYYDTLSRAICRGKQLAPGALVLIGSDANASIGRDTLVATPERDSAGLGEAVGPHGLDRINASNRRLRSFLETEELASLASFFHKPYYGTWQHPCSKDMHQLDHFLISRCDLQRFTDAGSVNGQLIGSDHRALAVQAARARAAQACAAAERSLQVCAPRLRAAERASGEA